MDLDGDLDILGSNFTSSEIAWFENNGSQSFVKRAISEGFFGAWDLQIADIDSDGDKDVIGTAFYGDDVAWFEFADVTAPTMTISAHNDGNSILGGSSTNDAVLNLVFTCSEITNNFVVGDITVTGGTISNFITSNSYVYTAVFTPFTSGSKKINVAANTFTDQALNSNTVASQLNWTYDGIAPTMKITASDWTTTVNDGSTTNNGLLYLTFTSIEPTTNFESEYISTTGGTISNFASSSSLVYFATFTSPVKGATSISVSGNKFTDAVKNGNNATDQFNWIYDGEGPTVTITAASGSNTDGTTTNDTSLILTFTSSEATSNFRSVI